MAISFFIGLILRSEALISGLECPLRVKHGLPRQSPQSTVFEC